MGNEVEREKIGLMTPKDKIKCLQLVWKPNSLSCFPKDEGKSDTSE